MLYSEPLSLGVGIIILAISSKSTETSVGGIEDSGFLMLNSGPPAGAEARTLLVKPAAETSSGPKLAQLLSEKAMRENPMAGGERWDETLPHAETSSHFAMLPGCLYSWLFVGLPSSHPFPYFVQTRGLGYVKTSIVTQ